VHRVTVLALDRVVPFDLGIPARVFGAARDADGRPLYEIQTCAIGGATVRTSSDYSVVVDHDERALADADTVVIATQEPEGALREEGLLDAEVRNALQHVGPDARLVSICTGSFVLAAAGFLDGREATTHWGWADRFAALFPKVRVRADVLFVDEGRLLTSAGAASGIDLCLHIVRRDHGAEVANGAARRCVVAPWRDGGQAQFVERPLPDHAETSTAATRLWARGRLGEALTLDDLARHANMSVRTFTRRFRAEIGMSPTQWLQRLRIEEACRLLESTALPVETIAHHVGFTDATLLRRHMRAQMGVAPLSYRRTFRGPGDAVAGA
jgi:transcriptional regulator GlxA family with amidase domain